MDRGSVVGKSNGPVSTPASRSAGMHDHVLGRRIVRLLKHAVELIRIRVAKDHCMHTIPPPTSAEMEEIAMIDPPCGVCSFI